MSETSNVFDVEQWPVGAASASIFVPVGATEDFSGTSEYARARAAAVNMLGAATLQVVRMTLQVRLLRLVHFRMNTTTLLKLLRENHG